MALQSGLTPIAGENGGLNPDVTRLRSRVIPRDESSPEVPLKPQARPYDNYARPAQAPIDFDLKNLAEGLAALNPALQGFADVEAAKAKKGAPDAAAAAVLGKTPEQIQALMKNPSADPNAAAAMQSELGRQLMGNHQASAQADSDVAYLTEFYNTKFDKNNGDLQGSINKFIAERGQGYLNNPGFAREYNQRMAAGMRGLLDAHAQYKSQETSLQQQITTHDAVVSKLRTIRDAGYNPEGANTEINKVLEQNNTVLNRSYKEQIEWVRQSVEPLIEDMKRDPSKRVQTMAIIRTVLDGERKDSSGVSRRLTELPGATGDVAKQTLAQAEKVFGEENDKAGTMDMATFHYLARHQPQAFDPAKLDEYVKANPGVAKAGEVQALKQTWLGARDQAGRALAEVQAERQVKQFQTDQTTNDLNALREYKLFNPGETKLPTKKMVLGNGEVEDFSTVSADQRIANVAERLKVENGVRRNALVNAGVNPQDADKTIFAENVDLFAQNGIAVPGLKQEMRAAVRQATTSLVSGGQATPELMQAYDRYKHVVTHAPNTLNEATDDYTRDFFEIARAGEEFGLGNPVEQLRTAAEYLNKRNAEVEGIKKAEVIKKLRGEEGWTATNAVKKFFGVEAFENAGVVQDKVVRTATLLATVYNVPPAQAIERSLEIARTNTAIVNGWLIDTNDKRLGNNFERNAEKYLGNFYDMYGKQVGAIHKHDLTLVPQTDGFMVFNKKTFSPVQGVFPLQNRDGQTFDAKFLTPERLQEVNANLREQEERRASKQAADRLQPLFVIPGTNLGMSRPTLQGYTPGEVKTINENIAKRSGAALESIQATKEDNAKIAAERNAEIEREERDFVPEQKSLRDALTFDKGGKAR